MNSQIANLPVVVVAGASLFLSQQEDCAALTLNTNYFQSVGAKNPNITTEEGLRFSPIDFAALEEANVVESKTESSEQTELETIFNGLAKNWREATGGYSLTMRRYAHPSYQSILALEPKRDVISLILRELQQRPDRWFEALKALTKANPAQDAKTFDETVQHWVEWGKTGKYTS